MSNSEGEPHVASDSTTEEIGTQETLDLTSVGSYPTHGTSASSTEGSSDTEGEQGEGSRQRTGRTLDESIAQASSAPSQSTGEGADESTEPVESL